MLVEKDSPNHLKLLNPRSFGVLRLFEHFWDNATCLDVPYSCEFKFEFIGYIFMEQFPQSRNGICVFWSAKS